MDSAQAAGHLAAALAVGLLVGLERGWRDRERPEGGRVAGLRTFALIGLLGGLLNLQGTASALPLAIGLAGVALLFAVSFQRASAATGTLSITSGVAAMVTFGLGALAASGHVVLATGSAAVVALLLGAKTELHQGMRRIQPAELGALLQLGVLTAVVLPLLPDAGLGPYAALNPFRLWLAVILLAALSLAGHVARRWRGAKQGLLWTGLLGGLASSTAATLTLARSARAQPAVSRPAAAAAVAACGVMFLRMALVAALLQPQLAWRLGGPLLLLACATFLAAAWFWRGGVAEDTAASTDGRVFDLPTAVGFGLLLGAVSLLSRAAQDLLGTAGVYAVGFLAGFADVDAPLVSALHMAGAGKLSTEAAMATIVLAVGANMVVKAGIAWVVGGRALGGRVLAGHGFVLLVAAAALALRTF